MTNDTSPAEPVAVEVEMHAFAGGAIRTVRIPANEWPSDTDAALERVFYYGQNDFQPQRMPSVSVGDVVRLGGARYMVAGMGFRRLD